MEIRNVLICGLGALGLTYANKLNDVCNLKILADNERIEKYLKKPPKFNGNTLDLSYIAPTYSWNADLIIITTKSGGLDSAINYIKNFINEKTIIISLINGISSEEKIQKAYPKTRVVRSFFIGHSAMKDDKCNNYTQDGVGKIVIEKEPLLIEFFKNKKIDYEVSENILYSQWLKLGVNIILNELTAIYNCSVGELRSKKEYYSLSKNLLKEVKLVAQAEGISNLKNYESFVLDNAKLVADDGKTSMYQDVLAKKKTEIEIFSGEIIRLGKVHNIKTPYNEDIYNKIKDIERNFS